MKNRKKNRNRPELPRYMTQASVDDETSSTSTESSVGEIEEKVSSISRFGYCQRTTILRYSAIYCKYTRAQLSGASPSEINYIVGDALFSNKQSC